MACGKKGNLLVDPGNSFPQAEIKSDISGYPMRKKSTPFNYRGPPPFQVKKWKLLYWNKFKSASCLDQVNGSLKFFSAGRGREAGEIGLRSPISLFSRSRESREKYPLHLFTPNNKNCIGKLFAVSFSGRKGPRFLPINND
jgi:hypothetical protein